MKILLSIILVCLCIPSIANIRYVQYENIPNGEKYSDKYQFILDHERYYNHWAPEWNYDISKESLVTSLKESYKTFLAMDNNQVEINLLLGDISHYLYNLNEEDYFELAVKHYQHATRLAPTDYRPHWFLANHYALSNVPDKSIECFLRSKELLPVNEPAAFWEEFMFATAIANMPSHCLMGMDKARAILDKPSYFEEQLGVSIHDRIIPVKSDSSYSYQDIWTASSNEMLTFISRPLGLKLLVDSTWQVNLYDYQNYQSAIIMVPPAIANKDGREITYTIAIIMRVAQTNDNLDNYINKIIPAKTDRKDFSFSDKYPHMVSLELEDQNMYPEIGGAHMHMIGIKREQPAYPGLLLEQPIVLPKGTTNELTFYKAGESKNRFGGTIYYAIMLDTCEDIYDEAYKLFKETFEKHIFIE